jgi:hypothetical protein
MALLVADTNVPVVANGRDGHADAECVAVCAKRLERFVRDRDRLAIDSLRLILREYERNLARGGEPGVGDAFLKWVLTNEWNRNRVVRVRITPEDSTFREFPSCSDLAAFHDDDRKFVAVARAHPKHPPILQAVDLDWRDFDAALRACGVAVEFLCV